mmetsp:Transcript_40079/g.121205  ORF Transcript_40079/g.121205 Transcript_40079/m.121205 type:complete len:284 (+) Transcript_40079:268-1119(+)
MAFLSGRALGRALLRHAGLHAPQRRRLHGARGPVAAAMVKRAAAPDPATALPVLRSAGQTPFTAASSACGSSGRAAKRTASGMREGPPNPPTRVPVCGARRRSLPVSSRRCGSGERRPWRRALRGERRQRTVRLPPLSTALSRRPSETGPPHRGRCAAAERELSPATSSRPLGPAVGPARRWMAVGTSLRGTCCRTFEGGRAVVLPRCRTLEGEHAPLHDGRCSESVGSRGSSLRTRSEGRVLANSDTGARRRVDCRLSEFSRVFLFEARSRLHDGESVSEYL